MNKAKLISAWAGMLLFAGATGPAVQAQSIDNPQVDYEMVEQFKEQGIDHSRVMEYASWLTDVYGPRLSNSTQMRNANAYTAQVFEEMGLENVGQHEWGPFGRGWDLHRFALHAYTDETYFPVTAYPKAWSPGYDEPVRGEVVYIDLEDEDVMERYEGELGDKFVMIEEPADKEFHFDPLASRMDSGELLEFANDAPQPERVHPVEQQEQNQQPDQELIEQAVRAYEIGQFLKEEEVLGILDQSYRGRLGQIAVSAASIPADPTAGWGERTRPWDVEGPDPVPQVSLTRDHYGRLYRLLEKDKTVELEMELEAEYLEDDLMGHNTVGEIPGTDPELQEEVVMIGAHMDSWHAATGATDNAAGTAVMMEVMRILKESGVEPRRTIRIALWDGEEQGLHGSRHYVTDHFAELGEGNTVIPKEDYENFSAYYNHDNGTGQIRGIYGQQNEEVLDLFRAWLDPFEDWGTQTASYSNTGATDHVSFDRAGLPGFQFIQDPIEYSTVTHHSNMDFFERLKSQDLKRNAVIIATFAYHTAMLDERLPRKNNVDVMAEEEEEE